MKFPKSMIVINGVTLNLLFLEKQCQNESEELFERREHSLSELEI